MIYNTFKIQRIVVNEKPSALEEYNNTKLNEEDMPMI
jgi:hypothetical protein